MTKINLTKLRENAIKAAEESSDPTVRVNVDTVIDLITALEVAREAIALTLQADVYFGVNDRRIATTALAKISELVE